MSVERTLKERGGRYGDFSVHAEICQDFMRVMKRARNQNAWPDLSDVQRQALTVIADKIARILSGDPNYADNWHDIQGYARLVEERLPSPDTTCPDCGAPEGDLHYVLCPRLPVPEAHAEAVEAAFNEQAQFDEARADIIGQNGNDGEHYQEPVNANDWRSWRVGDVLECVVEVDEGEEPIDKIAIGELCEVLEVEPPEYGGALPVKVRGEDYMGWPDFEDYDADVGAPLLQLFRFHHRPTKTDE